MIGKLKLAVVCCMGLLLIGNNVYAQNVPVSAKSGVVDRKQKKVVLDKKIGKTQIKMQQKDVKKPIEDTGIKFFLRELDVIGGQTVITTEFLKPIVTKYLDKEVTIGRLNQLCREIEQYCISEGYVLVKCYLPQQEIKDGLVAIEIVEGFLNKVVVKGNKYYETNFIKKHFASMEGQIFNYNKLLRQLNILNDFLNLQVKTYLEAGAEQNSTDMIIEVIDSLPVSVSMNYDNTGSRYVSDHKAGINVALGNLIKDGDIISLGGVVGSPASAYNQYSVSYQLPVTYSGTKLKISADRSSHELGYEFAPFDISGESETYRIGLTHPFVSGKTFTLDGFLDLEYKNTQDKYYGTTSADNDLSTLYIGASMQKADIFNGYNFITFKGAFGLSEDNNGYAASRLNTEENFSYLSLNYYRMQRFFKKLLFVIKADGQWSPDRLPTSQQYAIGGMYSVRGYTASRFLGDSGFSSSMELYSPIPGTSNLKVPFTNWILGEIAKLKIFIDYGYIKNQDVVSGEMNNEDIYGYGFGLDINTPNDCTINLSVGFAGDEKDPATDYSSVVYVSFHKKFM